MSTYRVVHINPPSASAASAVVQHGLPLANSSANNGAMTYIASTAGSDSLSSAGGFYVIGSSSDLLGGSGTGNGGGGSHPGSGHVEVPRDHRRRATHNEVERRRRDKINTWISKLAEILPDSTIGPDLTKSSLSKGAVLAQACDFIIDSKTTQAQNQQLLRENEKLQEDLKMLKRSNDALATANQILKAHLKSQGAVIMDPDQAGHH